MIPAHGLQPLRSGSLSLEQRVNTEPARGSTASMAKVWPARHRLAPFDRHEPVAVLPFRCVPCRRRLRARPGCPARDSMNGHAVTRSRRHAGAPGNHHRGCWSERNLAPRQPEDLSRRVHAVPIGRPARPDAGPGSLGLFRRDACSRRARATPGSAFIARFAARGAQVHTFLQDKGALIWSAAEPDAELDGRSFARHLKGPTWQTRDGTTVVGAVAAKAQAAIADAVLLLSARATGSPAGTH